MAGGQTHTQRTGAKGGAIYFLPPDRFTIVKDKDHFLHDPSARSWFDENRVQSIDEGSGDGSPGDELVKAPLPPIRIFTDKDDLLVVTGRERVIDACEANRRRKARKAPELWVPYVLVDGEEAELRDLVDIENTHRKVLGPATIAKKIRWRREAKDSETGEPSYSDERIAFVLNLTRDGKPVRGQAASNLLDSYLEVLDCPAVVRDAIDAGEIPRSLSSKYKGMPADRAKEVLEKQRARGLKGKKAERFVKAAKRGKEDEVAAIKEDRPLTAARLKKLVAAFDRAIDKKDSPGRRAARGAFAYASGNKDAFDDMPELAKIASSLDEDPGSKG